MKVRNGFVSNSSSSSFMIERKYISDEQWKLIETRETKFKEMLISFFENPEKIDRLSKDSQYELNYLKDYWEGDKEGFLKDLDWGNNWNICVRGNEPYLHRFHEDESEDVVIFSTIINNFDMDVYLDMIGVDISKIFNWSD